VAARTPKDPLAILYKRWRNVRHRYLVDVLDVKNYSGESLGVYRTVKVRQVRTKVDRTWPAEVFLRSFQPVGQKVRTKTAWDILQE
jgi:hypothetical protein